VHDLLVEGAKHFLKLAPGVAHVTHLGVQVLVAVLERGELFQGERIDGPERSDSSLELAHALLD
jgi:hypothetical protein